MSGLPKAAMPAQRPVWSLCSWSTAVRSAISEMSAPAAKTRGPPVRTTALTFSSASRSRRASLTSRMRSGLSALRTLGRLRVIVAIGASTSTRMFSYPIVGIIRHVGTALLRDSYGRIADDLRISITDRCNFRCIYCMPAEGLKWLKRDDLLRFEEITRLARIFVQRYGVRTIRITGGEPLVRVKVEELVGMIEFMPLDGDGTWTNEQVVPSRRIQEQIEDLFPLVPVNDTRPGPATRFKFADGAQGGLGFISSVSQAFCTTCNRVRLTAEGGLRTCLFPLPATPLRDLLRSAASGAHLGRVIEAEIWHKEEGHLINKPGFIKTAKNMSQIGG